MTKTWVALVATFAAAPVHAQQPDPDVIVTARADGSDPPVVADARGPQCRVGHGRPERDLDARTLAPGASTDATTRLFAGAKETAAVDAYEENLGIKQFDLMIDWGWFHFITKPMFRALDFFYHLFGNFGVSILVVTAILKLFFLPIANRS